MVDLQNMRLIANKPLPSTPKYNRVVSQTVWTHDCLETMQKHKGLYGSTWKFKFVEDILIFKIQSQSYMKLFNDSTIIMEETPQLRKIESQTIGNRKLSEWRNGMSKLCEKITDATKNNDEDDTMHNK